MKKIFPVIIALITLSLCGIIYIQVKWVQSMLIVKSEQFNEKIVRAIDGTGKELMEQRGLGLGTNVAKNNKGIKWQSEQLDYDIARPPRITERFSIPEIYDKMRNYFNSEGLKDVQFEIAVSSGTSGIGYYEKSSDNFQTLYEDTIRSKLFIYHLIPPSGSMAEGLAQDEMLKVVVPNVNNIVWRSLQWMIAGVVFFTLIIISAFFLTVGTLLRQKKLSEIKSDFINNMTHEFKTPLATISLAIDALRTEKVKQDPAKSAYFSGIIKEENNRMNKHVETILQAAITDRQELQFTKKELNVNEIITQTVGKFRLQLNEKGAVVNVHLQAAKDTIIGDDVHFSNMISNLVDNAVKYSNGPLILNVSSSNRGKYIVVKVEDNGIGMSKETVKRIFEKFYRAHTGNLHNVKGFGLGLSYVKSVVEAHNGRIKAESVPGKGSSFILELPLKR